jgi:hypothetical protein
MSVNLVRQAISVFRLRLTRGFACRKEAQNAQKAFIDFPAHL